MTKFNVGDRFKKVRNGNHGSIITIKSIGTSTYESKEDISGCWSWSEKYLIENFELVKEEPKFYGKSVSNVIFDEGGMVNWGHMHEMFKTQYLTPGKINSNKKTIMSGIRQFAKDLVLSADEKLLRKHGLKDGCGEYSDTAKEIVTEKIMTENEEYLVDIATKMEKENNKK